MPNPVVSAQMKGSGVNVPEGDIAVGLPLISQPGHGFSVGTVIRQQSAIAFTEARASSVNAIGVGLSLVIDVPDANTYTMMVGHGRDLTWGGHGLGGFGTKLWLSQTVLGGMTATRPDTGLILYLGYVIDGNTIRWEPWTRAEEE